MMDPVLLSLTYAFDAVSFADGKEFDFRWGASSAITCGFYVFLNSVEI